MRKQAAPKDFKIHVDPSCLSEKFESNSDMPAERATSNETIVHHASWAEGDLAQSADQKEEEAPEQDEEEENTAPAPGTTDDKELRLRERQIERIEAEIKAAARNVVATIESDEFSGPNDSVLSTRTDESYEPEHSDVSFDGIDETELSYGESAEPESNLMGEHEEAGGDSSSQHDGDIDDDVFSHSDQSKRSSLNSVHELQSADEAHKLLTSPTMGEEAASTQESDVEVISRIPSGTSYMQASEDTAPRTPSKVLSRPPFRTPSSVRAMQMSSPTPSVFSTPRSVKRHMPTVSRLGTPTSQNFTSRRTPTRLKPKKENPLVLLHVTLLPLQWPYSHLMSSPEVPESLYKVKESWRLLQEKVGDTVLERGVLLPHPQDSYDVLEERLLEALELPVRPRAMILKCGHYMGPIDSECPTSDEEDGDFLAPMRTEDGRLEERKWCDICGRDVKLEEVGQLDRGEKRFRIKIYASNGLMRAGAWAAAWREMERVDVEIEPFVETTLQPELDQLSIVSQRGTPTETHQDSDEAFEDEEVIPEHVPVDEHEKSEEELKLEEELRQHVEKEAERERVEQNESRRQSQEADALRRKAMEEERMREIYGAAPTTPAPRSAAASRANINEDSLSDLLLAASKVLLQDRRNIVIGVLSVLVLLLAVLPRGMLAPAAPSAVMATSSMAQVSSTATATVEVPAFPLVTTTVIQERTVTESVVVPTTVNVVVEQSMSVEDVVPTSLSAVVVEAAEEAVEVLSSSISTGVSSLSQEVEPTPLPLTEKIVSAATAATSAAASVISNVEAAFHEL